MAENSFLLIENNAGLDSYSELGLCDKCHPFIWLFWEIRKISCSVVIVTLDQLSFIPEKRNIIHPTD